ncbi:hypothetical protein ElyMa_006764400 [Elysia marginata]|uniref:Uncharacterized protein n=1 Tax=Elysia marginata TaxID=1093978 RepID=A0AAV4IYC1_9GAST|nr:hypothetical protein ElyMa_006764400 [Elysia marginata]
MPTGQADSTGYSHMIGDKTNWIKSGTPRQKTGRAAAGGCGGGCGCCVFSVAVRSLMLDSPCYYSVRVVYECPRRGIVQLMYTPGIDQEVGPGAGQGLLITGPCHGRPDRAGSMLNCLVET